MPMATTETGQTKNPVTPDHFAQFLNQFDIKTMPLDMDREKPDTLSFKLASFVEHVRKFATAGALNGRGEPMQLHAGVTIELDGNAFAIAEDGRHYIGITFGHFLSSSYFSIESFFRTNSFLDIGTAPKNDPSKFELCPEEGFWDEHGESTLTGFSTIQAHDRARVGACYFLNYAITMLAFFHEYFHIVLGHCPVMGKLGLQGRIFEIG